MKFKIRFRGSAYANELYGIYGQDTFKSLDEAVEQAQKLYPQAEFEIWETRPDNHEGGFIGEAWSNFTWCNETEYGDKEVTV